MKRVVALFAVLALAVPAAAPCQSSEEDFALVNEYALTGWAPFIVVAEGLPSPEATRRGVTADWIKGLAELQLRTNQIDFLQNPPYWSKEGFLTVICHAMYVERFDHFVYWLEVDAYRLSPPFGFVGVWKRGTLGIVPAVNLKAKIAESVETVVNQFSVDYLRANSVGPPH